MFRRLEREPRRPSCLRMPTLVACALPIVFMVLVGTPIESTAQSVESRIRGLVGANAEGYLRPVSDGMTFALTGGLLDGPAARRGLSFDLGLRVLGALPGDASREFMAVLPDTVRWQAPGGQEQVFDDPFRPVGGSLRTPTAVGEGPGIVLEPAGGFRQELVDAGENPEDFQLRMPDGFDLRAVPAAMLTVSIGVGLGTELQARFLPRVAADGEVGRIGARGWGVQHTLSHWLDSPLDVSLAVGQQALEVGDYLNATASEGWLLVGRGLGPLTLYGTAGVRRADVDVEYAIENPDGLPGIPASGTVVRFGSNLDTTTALGAGFRLQLLFMNLAGQYTAGDWDTFSLKVGLGLP